MSDRIYFFLEILRRYLITNKKQAVLFLILILNKSLSPLLFKNFTELLLILKSFLFLYVGFQFFNSYSSVMFSKERVHRVIFAF